jgi:hypothetical protein
MCNQCAFLEWHEDEQEWYCNKYNRGLEPEDLEEKPGGTEW